MNAYKLNDTILMNPKVFSKTKEVERSVINIHIDYDTMKTTMESSVPEVKGNGTKPVITWEEYLTNFKDNEQIAIIENFKRGWEQLEPEDGIHMGTVGFSAGVVVNDRRNLLQIVYDDNLEILTEVCIERRGILKEDYLYYKNELSKFPKIYDKYVVSNKKFINFSDISNDELKGILQAAYNLGVKIKKESQYL